MSHKDELERMENFYPIVCGSSSGRGHLLHSLVAKMRFHIEKNVDENGNYKSDIFATFFDSQSLKCLFCKRTLMNRHWWVIRNDECVIVRPRD